MITTVEKLSNFYVKREDKAGWTSLDYPSGSKVRQYTAMAQPGIPMIVGCASHSAMQIYVAAAAHQNSVPGIIITAKRKSLTDATLYAKDLGAQITEVYPGYMNVVRSRAKERAKQLGKTVRWDVRGAIEDAALQVQNLPDCKRIIVPTGSGLTAVGILVGLARLGRNIPVVSVAVSDLADASSMIGSVKRHLGTFGSLIPGPDIPILSLIRHPKAYGKHVVARLPDGTPLDPFYAAKTLEYVSDGDCLWVPGLRPVRAMPKDCQREFADWKGFVGA